MQSRYPPVLKLNTNEIPKQVREFLFRSYQNSEIKEKYEFPWPIGDALKRGNVTNAVKIPQELHSVFANRTYLSSINKKYRIEEMGIFSLDKKVPSFSASEKGTTYLFNIYLNEYLFWRLKYAITKDEEVPREVLKVVEELETKRVSQPGTPRSQQPSPRGSQPPTPLQQSSSIIATQEEKYLTSDEAVDLYERLYKLQSKKDKVSTKRPAEEQITQAEQTKKVKYNESNREQLQKIQEEWQQRQQQRQQQQLQPYLDQWQQQELQRQQLEQQQQDLYASYYSQLQQQTPTMFQPPNAEIDPTSYAWAISCINLTPEEAELLMSVTNFGPVPLNMEEQTQEFDQPSTDSTKPTF